MTPHLPLKRPGLLTALCVFVWVGNAALLVLARRIDWQAKGYPHWFLHCTFVLAAVHVIAAIGVWQMRRWGVVLTVLWLIGAQSVLLAIHHWTLGSLTGGLIEIGILMRYRRELR